MNRKLLVFAGLAVLLVAIPLLGKLTRGDGAKAVDVTPAATQVIRSSILSSGLLAYREQVELRSEVIGKATAVNFNEGDRVKAGDVVIALDPDQFRAQVEQQRANVRIQEIAIERQRLLLENLERQVERQREMFSRELIDPNTFEAAESELLLAHVDLRSREESLLQARATLAQAEDNLARTMIRSPIDGIIIKLDVEPGEAVISGTTNIPASTLAQVADPSVMLAQVQVDEADIAQIRLEQNASVFAAAWPDIALEGVVESIAASAEQATGQQNRSFEVKIRLAEQDGVELRPGMSCRVEVHTESSEGALAVPLQAVLYDEDTEADAEQAYVFVVEDEKAVRRNVTPGLSSDSHMEIVDGLVAGDTVVTGPFRVLRHLKDGERVEPATETATDAE